MAIYSNLTTFNGKQIVDYNPKTGIDQLDVAYRLRLTYELNEQKVKLVDWINQIAESPEAPDIKELVIGIWDFYDGESSEAVVKAIIDHCDKFTGLQALMIGDITYEENEISWIQQSDMEDLLKAYPYLRHLQVRGGNGLRFSNLHHENLQKLIVETGGLGPDTIQDIVDSKLPNLEHLELWLGSKYYGFSSTIEDIETLMNKSKFPQLNYLGLRDSEIADDIAKELKRRSVMDRIEVLDLSLGILSDKGAEDLFENPKIHRLQLLDLHYHYISDDWVKKLQSLSIDINLSDQQKAKDEEDRYVAVSE